MKIAVYTIALNEEQFVERWFESVKEADYWLIADTGSTDKTIEKARELGITVVPISIKPWRFDDARNTALSLLPADIDYCISMDMDEVMSKGWREHLEKMTADQIDYIFNYTFKDEAMKVPLIRFVNNRIHKRNGFRWKWMIHECLVNSRTENTIEFCEGLEVSHKPDIEKSRGQYLDMLEDSLKEHPDDERLTFYYGLMLLAKDMKEESFEVFKKLTKMNVVDKSYLIGTYIALAAIDPKNKIKYYTAAEKVDPQRREPLINKAIHYYKNSNWEKCYEYAEKALEINIKHVGLTTQEIAWSYLPYNLLAASRHNKELDKKSKTYKKDLWKFNVDSLISIEFDLYQEVKDEKPVQVLFDPM
jgi:glycosyltransferase involved in cell wall biosynthesis